MRSIGQIIDSTSNLGEILGLSTFVVSIHVHPIALALHVLFIISDVL